MSHAFDDQPQQRDMGRGLIGWFARNHVAANLLFVLLLVIGALSVLQTKLEVFPQIDPRIVTVSVPYPGANPEEVEAGVILRVEEAVADVEGIKKLGAVAAEGQGVVTVEAESGIDMDDFYEDVKAAVDRIATFPADAEEPVVSEASDKFQVMTVALHGEVDRQTLREQAELLKDDLQQSGGVSQVDIDGIPPYEISVNVRPADLRRYQITFQDVANALRDSSLDLPAGTVDGPSGQVLIRSTSQRYRGVDFEEVVIRTLGDGTRILVRDVADVVDGFEDNDYAIQFNGEPAVLLNVFRTGDEGALNVAATVMAYVEDAQNRLPPNISIATYNDSSILLQDRIDLMLRNALIGLALVVLLLGLFLDLRLAFWTALGLTMSVVASFMVLPVLDVSINMISLFAFILVLGILVDDAIVVGENIQSHRERGKSTMDAAIDGTREVWLPVTMTILTTVIAFAPLLFAEGAIGQILAVIPVVVIAVLVLSLVEALLILPAHLGGGDGWEPRFYTKIRTGLATQLERFTQGPYKWLLTLATRFRYVTLASGIAIMALTIGMIRGGILPWQFFPEVESDIVTVNVEMPPGATADQTQAIIDRLEAGAQELARQTATLEDGGPLIKQIQSAVGGTPIADISGGPGATSIIASRDPRLGEIVVELTGGASRDTPAAEVQAMWEEIVGPVVGPKTVEFRSDLIRAGEPINVELRSKDQDALRDAADFLKDELSKIEGVREIADNSEDGRPEVRVTGLTPLGESLGLRASDVFRQVRGAFFGEEAQRVQRGRDEVRVYVRYPEDARESLADVEDLYIRLPDGTEAPLDRVAELEEGTGYSAIRRTDRRRVVSVTADVDVTKVTSSDIAELLTQDTVEEQSWWEWFLSLFSADDENDPEGILGEMTERFPSVTWSLEGEQQEQAESLVSLQLAMLVALVGIYAMLAVLFRSYVQPIVVMSAIPFGFAGAAAGHLVMHWLVRDTPLTFLSLFGVVALAGVVVNDSLIMIDLINRNRMRDGDSNTGIEQGVIDAGLRRFRPIFLTTVTTFFGLVPIILETSLQAQFIIPMAISLGFGIVFATAITLLLVPSFYLIVEDLRRMLLPIFGRRMRYEGPGFDIGGH
jgi:multidrug efflux pump subunit AcrB